MSQWFDLPSASGFVGDLDLHPLREVVERAPRASPVARRSS
jgi:hypothetical protein